MRMGGDSNIPLMQSMARLAMAIILFFTGLV